MSFKATLLSGNSRVPHGHLSLEHTTSFQRGMALETGMWALRGQIGPGTVTLALLLGSHVMLPHEHPRGLCFGAQCSALHHTALTFPSLLKQSGVVYNF